MRHFLSRKGRKNHETHPNFSNTTNHWPNPSAPPMIFSGTNDACQPNMRKRPIDERYSPKCAETQTAESWHPQNGTNIFFDISDDSKPRNSALINGSCINRRYNAWIIMQQRKCMSCSSVYWLNCTIHISRTQLTSFLGRLTCHLLMNELFQACFFAHLHPLIIRRLWWCRMYHSK